MIDSPWRGWEFPGGQIEEGEPVLTGLKREVHEETGARVDVGPLAGVYSNLSQCVVILTFLARYQSGELTPSAESLRVEWFERDHCLEQVSHPAVRARLEDLLNYQLQPVYRAYTVEPYAVVEELKPLASPGAGGLLVEG